MATCRCGDLVVNCRGGCGCACEVDPPRRCWVWCEGLDEPVPVPPNLRPTFPGLAAFVGPADGQRNLHGATRVRFHSQDVSLGSIAVALDNLAQDGVCAPVDRLGEKKTTTLTGTLDEVLKALGLESVKRREPSKVSAARGETTVTDSCG